MGIHYQSKAKKKLLVEISGLKEKNRVIQEKLECALQGILDRDAEISDLKEDAKFSDEFCMEFWDEKELLIKRMTRMKTEHVNVSVIMQNKMGLLEKNRIEMETEILELRDKAARLEAEKWEIMEDVVAHDVDLINAIEDEIEFSAEKDELIRRVSRMEIILESVDS
jgi:hypothetical protein